MKFLKRLILGIILILAISAVGLMVTGNSHLFKGVANTYLKGKIGPSIDEHHIFLFFILEHGDPLPWQFDEAFGRVALSQEDLDFHREWESVAFLVIKEGKIIFEKYWEDYDPVTISNSFSMSKSIVGLATGIALDEGLFDSLDQSAAYFIPELKGTEKEKITI